MTDQAHADDAPPASWTTGDARAAIGLPEAKGDTISGRAVTINRPIAELFAYFRDFSNLSTFMENVVRVDVHDRKRSHWVVKAPAGRTVEWDATIVDEEPGRSFTRQSDEGADVPNSSRVDFVDAGARRTVVTATIAYDPPAGTIGKLVAKLFQREPAIQARRDLQLYDGYIPTMQACDLLGHEFMGEVVEVGAKSTLKKGQRFVVPFTIACGSCHHCGKHQYSACDNHQERPRRCRQERLGRADGGLDEHRLGLEEQDPVGDGQRHPQRRPGRTASQDGRARQRPELSGEETRR